MPALLLALHLVTGTLARPLMPADAPVVDPPMAAATRDAPPIEGQAPSAVRLLEAATHPPSARFFPRFSLVQYLTVVAGVFARPINPQPGDGWVWGITIGATAIALMTDVQTHRAIQEIPDPEVWPGYTLGGVVSLLGEGWVDFAVFVAIGLFGGRDGRRAAVAGLTALAVSGVVTRIGKLVFRRERPKTDPDRDHWFADNIAADAFPSGHAMCAFATAAVLASEYPQLSVLWYGLAAWVGLARIQVSTHWLSDVIVGAAFGLLIGWEAWRLTRALEIQLEPWIGGDSAGMVVSKQF
jgi:membrane-associated phospholipid phosphatase